MRTARIGNLDVSALCIGGNPFSGFSHQTPERSTEMVEYYTPERIHETLRAAEANGINTMFARTDDHIHGVIRDYRDAGGTLQWFAQVCGTREDLDEWRRWLAAAVELGCAAAYLHGGLVDYWFAQGQSDLFREFAERGRDAGVAIGFAAHRTEPHEWIRDNLDVDFQMCCWYNPTDRTQGPHHVSIGEKWNDEDRAKMLATIATIQKPVVHYKIFGGGNKPIVEAFETLGRAMRPNDVACLGIFTKDDPDIIAKDVALFEEHVGSVRAGS